jgi:hypothetical protein
VAYQEDEDNLTYTIDMLAYLNGATITAVTRIPNGLTISNSSNTASRITQRLKGFGRMDVKVTLSNGDTEQFFLGIAPRASSTRQTGYAA